ncbi:hypothetical protein Taro_045793 [Colocasia esculenta]|uniref:Uncharacterized protein n=1 Tax=Colocasia esculenta TaxID=4460 RepID=A0A843WQF9_COLES|nr:hypothetical protein [Colocasia esculenta]
MPSVDTSSVGSPRFCVSQARECSVLVPLGPESLKVPGMGLLGVWPAGCGGLVGLHSFSYLFSGGQLDLSSVAARLRGGPVWFVRARECSGLVPVLGTDEVLSSSWTPSLCAK